MGTAGIPTPAAADLDAPASGEPSSTAARSPWSLVWRRLKRNRAALAGGIIFLGILLMCFVGAPVAAHALGHGPDDVFPYAVSDELKPVGPWTRVPDVTTFVDVTADTPRTLLILGADGTLGRDQFLRLLYGGQVSLQIGLGAMLLSLLIGVPFGIVSGYLGGKTDWIISRGTELFMGFPLLLFLAAIVFTVGPRFGDITLRGLFQPGVLVLIVLIGAFSWFLPARIIRAQVLSLREHEFVEAARMVGAGDGWIMRKHILPHLVAPIVVWGTLICASFIVFEAAISVLNVGVKLPTASWGNMFSANWGTLLVFDPLRAEGAYYVERSHWVVFWPSAALFLSIVSLAVFGEGLRRAIDPQGRE